MLILLESPSFYKLEQFKNHEQSVLKLFDSQQASFALFILPFILFLLLNILPLTHLRLAPAQIGAQGLSQTQLAPRLFFLNIFHIYIK